MAEKGKGEMANDGSGMMNRQGRQERQEERTDG
jgi:hypothetical protein